MPHATLERKELQRIAEERLADDSRQWRRSIGIDATLLIGVATVAFVSSDDVILQRVVSNAQVLTLVLVSVGFILLTITAIELRKSATLAKSYMETRSRLTQAFERIDKRRERDEEFSVLDDSEASRG